MKWKLISLFIGALVLAAAPVPADRAAVMTVIVVRHAEKLDDSDDSPLSPAGEARAKELAKALGDVKVGAIYVSKWRRTGKTASPLAQAKNLTMIELSDPAKIVEAIRRDDVGRVVLVVSHSDKVPKILKSLGVSDRQDDLPSREYDNLFICTVAGDASMLLHLRSGAATP